jgi:hypothetical protein
MTSRRDRDLISVIIIYFKISYKPKIKLKEFYILQNLKKNKNSQRIETMRM